MPRFSVIIPTRNAYRYAGYAARSALVEGVEDVEVVISDNHSTQGTLEELGREILDDRRVRVVRPPRELSMTAHFNYALGESKGDWIALIGSDDGLMPHFYPAVKRLLARDSQTKAIVGRRALYFWPGCERVYGARAILVESRPRCRWVKSDDEAARIVGGRVSYFDSLQLYTGSVVHRSVIEQVCSADVAGDFYQGTQPDMYSTFALLSVLPGFTRTDLPIAWTGTSLASNGLANTHPDVGGRVAEDFWTLGEEQDAPPEWELDFGRETPIPLLVLQSAIQAGRLGSAGGSPPVRDLSLLAEGIAGALRQTRGPAREMVLISADRLGLSRAKLERRAAVLGAEERIARNGRRVCSRFARGRRTWNIDRRTTEELPTIHNASQLLARTCDWARMIDAAVQQFPSG
jgi:hypothetical protein